MTQLVGRSIGRYHIVEQLGEGGMAQVYKAYDNRLERYVAVKVILPSQEQSEMFLKRFEREAKSLAQFTHSNIVRVLDYGEQDGMPYLIMEYISGGTLKQRMGKPVPYHEAARLLVPIAQALHAAHQRGIFHRDVKPANILINEDGQPLLSDFGIAKVLETKEQNQATLTGAGVGIGTPEYMSPEQGMGQAIDQRTDVYSLGVVFYELVTGRRPFRADTPMAVVVKQISEPLPRPTDYAPQLPLAVEEVIFKAMAKNPDDRFQDMEAFTAALERLTVPNLPAARETVPAESSTAATMAAPAATVAAAGSTVAAPGPTRAAMPGTLPAGGKAQPAQPAGKKPRSKLPLILAGVGGLAVVAVVLVVGIILLAGRQKGAGGQASLNQPAATEPAPAQATRPAQAEETQPGAAKGQPSEPGPASDSPTAPSAEPAAPEAQGDTFSVKDITSALQELTSFRLNFEGTTEGKDASGNAVTVQSVLVEEADNAKSIRHLSSKKTGGDYDEAYEFYIVNGVTYVYNATGQTCESAGTGQQALIAATVPLAGQIVGVVENAILGGKGETANGVAADRYAFDHTSLPTSGLSAGKGDLWVAADGGYVVKLEAAGSGPAGNVAWHYNLTDVNRPVAIQLPEACTASPSGALDIPLPANATGVSNLSGMITFQSPDSPSVVANFFKLAMPQKGWEVQFQTGTDMMSVLIFIRNDETLQVMIQPDMKGGSSATINKMQ